MYCSRCGNRLLKNAKFCRRCGNFIESQPDTHVVYTQDFPKDEDKERKGKRKGALLAMILALVALILAGGWIFLRPSPQMTFSDAMERGNYYLVKLNFEQAEVYFRRAMEIDPRQVQPYIELAYIYSEHFDDEEQALEILEQGMHEVAEEDIPDLIEVWGEITTLPPPIPIDEEHEVEEETVFEIRWVLEPSIEADDINYVQMSVGFARSYTNDNKRHFQSSHAVIRRGDDLGLIDNNGNINGDMGYNSISIFFRCQSLHIHGRQGIAIGYYLLSLAEPVEMEVDGEVRFLWDFILENDEIVPLIGSYGDTTIPTTFYHFEGLLRRYGGVVTPYEESHVFSIPIPVIDVVEFDPEVYAEGPWWNWYLEYEGVGLHGVLYQGEMLTDFIYTRMGSYIDGLLAVELDGKWGYINRYGEVIIPIEYDASWSLQGWMGHRVTIPFAYAASEGFVPLVKDGIWELRDVTGELVIPPGIFDVIRPVHGGRSWVKKDGLWGIIQVTKDEREEPEPAVEEQEEASFPPEDWEEWFAIPYAQWEDYIEFAGILRGGIVYTFKDSEGTLGFWGEYYVCDEHGFRANPEALPIEIGLPMVQFMGVESISVQELRNRYGDEFTVEYLSAISYWRGTLITDDHRIAFALASENDSDIRFVTIMEIR